MCVRLCLFDALCFYIVQFMLIVHCFSATHVFEMCFARFWLHMFLAIDFSAWSSGSHVALDVVASILV